MAARLKSRPLKVTIPMAENTNPSAEAFECADAMIRRAGRYEKPETRKLCYAQALDAFAARAVAAERAKPPGEPDEAIVERAVKTACKVMYPQNTCAFPRGCACSHAEGIRAALTAMGAWVRRHEMR